MCVTWRKKNVYFFTRIGQEVAAAKNMHFSKIVINSDENLSLFWSCLERWKVMKAKMARNAARISIIHVFSMKCQIIDVLKQ